MLFQARSINIFETAAKESFCFTYRRIRKSECKNSGNSFLDAYQRDRQSLFKTRRNPIGLTFCPINYSFSFFADDCRLGVLPSVEPLGVLADAFRPEDLRAPDVVPGSDVAWSSATTAAASAD